MAVESVQDFDDALIALGSFGYWQRVIFVLVSLPDVCFAMAILVPVLISATPDWGCALDVDSAENNHFLSYTTVASTNASAEELHRCEDVACSREFRDDFTSIASEWDLVCSRRNIPHTITTIQMTGLMLGAGVFAQLSDSFGRKRTYFSTCALMLVAGVASGLSINWQMFAVMRFFVGVACGGYFCINCVYTVEFVPPRWRTLCGTIGFWSIGEMILALMGYFIRSWRYLTIVTSLLIVLYTPAWWVVPDTPRWLATHNRKEEAKDVLSKIARKNNLPVPPLDFIDHIGSKSNENGGGKNKTYLDLYKSRKMALRSIIVFALWMAAFLTYYGLSYNLEALSGSRYLNLFYAGFVDLGAMVFVVVLTNIIGRKLSVALYLGISALLLVVIMITLLVDGNLDEHPSVVKVAALVGKGSALATTYVVQIFTAELYPTPLRNCGIGVGSIAARVGGLLAPQTILLGTITKSFPYIFWTTVCLVPLPLMLLLPETNKLHLEDEMQGPLVVKVKQETPAGERTMTNL